MNRSQLLIGDWSWLLPIVATAGHSGDGYFALCEACDVQCYGYGFWPGFCEQHACQETMATERRWDVYD